MLSKIFKLVSIIILFLYQNSLYSKTTADIDFNSKYLSNYLSALLAYNSQNNDEAIKYFDNNSNVIMHHGNSHEELPKVVDGLDEEPALFFFDAHFPDSYRDNMNREVINDDPDHIKIPLEGELRILCDKRDVSKDIIVIDDIRIYKDGPYENGNFENKALHGGENLDFVEELLDETHVIVESFLQEGYLICFPIDTDVDELRKYVVGAE